MTLFMRIHSRHERVNHLFKGNIFLPHLLEVWMPDGLLCRHPDVRIVGQHLVDEVDCVLWGVGDGLLDTLGTGRRELKIDTPGFTTRQDNVLI